MIRHSAGGSILTADLTLKINASDNTLVMTVQYTDTDAAAGVVGKIFKNGSSSRERSSDTRGQALSLVKNLVHDLNGTITSETLSGRDTIVTLSVPQNQ